MKNQLRIVMIPLLMCVASSVWAADIPNANSPGGQLYTERCSTCHVLPHPKRLDWEGWRHMLRLMKMRMDEKGMQMDKAEWQQIAAYVKAHAR